MILNLIIIKIINLYNHNIIINNNIINIINIILLCIVEIISLIKLQVLNENKKKKFFSMF